MNSNFKEITLQEVLKRLAANKEVWYEGDAAMIMLEKSKVSLSTLLELLSTKKFYKEANERLIGVQTTGLLAPIIRQGDDLVKIVTDTVLGAIDKIEDGDIIGITESVVARAEGNYVTIDEVVEDIKRVLHNPKYVYLEGPIYSRNRFAMILKAFARAVKEKVYIWMPDVDYVGNVAENHPFTGLNYRKYYREIVEAEGKKCIISDDKSDFIEIWPDSSNTGPIRFPDEYKVNCHNILYKYDKVYHNLTDFCKDKCEWGLLGSNKASEEKLKLFPSKAYSEKLVTKIQASIINRTGSLVQVFIYGDGCFKDPIGGIWEFADPVTSPAYTSGLVGTPNELKLKNLADEKFAGLNGKALEEAIKGEIEFKNRDLKGNMSSQGTTPRRFIDLLVSLSDLCSGSGDKGTPFVYIKNYFKNYGTEK